MINPANMPADAEFIGEQRDWLAAHKSEKGFSWPIIAGLIGIPAGTLSSFSGGTYIGRNDKIAAEIFKYRQTMVAQEARATGLIERPGYFETRSSLRLMGLLTLAHGGRITLAATSPGTGKTMVADEYAASASNVTKITMRKSARTVNAMTLLVLRALGIQTKGAWGTQLSDLVIDRLRGRRALLIVDEANHLSIDQFEEIRSWHDVPGGPGICFFGNEELIVRIESGRRSDAFARLHSRIASSHQQTAPLEEDVTAFCDAWQIQDAEMRNLLRKIALTPAAGGLREIAQIVEQASMIAADEHRALTFDDLREAKATRATRHIH